MPSPPTQPQDEYAQPTGSEASASARQVQRDSSAPSPHSVPTLADTRKQAAAQDETPTSHHRSTTNSWPTIPGHVLVRPLGVGGMGEVYEAINRLGRHVALKLIRADRSDPEFLIRFRNEAAALQDLDHPNVARLFEYNEHEGVPYFTMRLLTGGSLAKRLGEFRADPKKAVELMATIADAVGYVHRRNLLHRDLKPSNVLFDESGRPHVSDFGLVKGLAPSPPSAEDDTDPTDQPPEPAASESTLTVRGQRMGTLPYMAPEQVRGDNRLIGPHTDVWALGVILYEVLTGVRPFRGPDYDALRASIEADSPALFVDQSPPVDAGLRAIILRCLAKPPADRYASAVLLSEDLRRWLRAGEPASPPMPKPRPLISRRAMLLAGCVAAVAAGLGIAGALWPRPPQPKPAPDAIASMRQELTQGGQTPLLRVDGQPRHAEWITGESELEPSAGEDGQFSFTARKFSLLELMRGTSSGFRLSAEVRQTGAKGGSVGVYVGRSGHETPAGTWHYSVGLTFDDRDAMAPPGKGSVVLAVHACRAPDGKPSVTASPIKIAMLPLPRDGWRRLVVEFTPASLRVHVDGAAFAEVSRSTLAAYPRKIAAARRHPELKALTPTFAPGEGVGIISLSSPVAVRRINLERLS